MEDERIDLFESAAFDEVRPEMAAIARTLRDTNLDTALQQADHVLDRHLARIADADLRANMDRYVYFWKMDFAMDLSSPLARVADLFARACPSEIIDANESKELYGRLAYAWYCGQSGHVDRARSQYVAIRDAVSRECVRPTMRTHFLDMTTRHLAQLDRPV